jgi:arylsulfatase A-like enzyme
VALLTWILPWLLACEKPKSAPQPDIVLIVIDTLRADRLPFHGGERTAPFLETLSRRAAVFANAWSASSWTAPATASLFTSLYPLQHGVWTGYLAAQDRAGDELVQINCIPPATQTLPEFLQEQGYRTFGIGDNLNIGTAEGFDRGFDQFVTFDYEGADRVQEVLEQWAVEIGESSPSFVYLHYMDPHVPYHLHEDFQVAAREPSPWPDLTTLGKKPWEELCKRRNLDPAAAESYQAIESWLQHRVQSYDSEILYLDDRIRRALQILGVGKDDLLILTADHGEEFADHGRLGHGYQIYPELLRVPLLFCWPEGGIETCRISSTVSLLDLLPTLRDLLGTPAAAEDQGRSLWPALQGQSLAEERFYPMRVNDTLKPPGHKMGVVDGSWYLIRNHPGDRLELYDLAQDPSTRVDLAAEQPDLTARLHQDLQSFTQSLPILERTFSEPRVLSEETQRHLQELGYVREEDS